MMQDHGRESDTTSLEREDISTADLAGRREAQGTAEVVREPQQSGASAQPLFPDEEARELRDHWQSIQGGFVDEPRKAVEHADGLVATTMKRLAEIFASERDRLESQWGRGDDVSTEDLRIALQRYRSFFDRLLSI